ncbi:MAG: hypothetical protein WCP36_01545 [Methanomicrobiales archaeon]
MKAGIPVLFCTVLLIALLICGCSSPTPREESPVPTKSSVTTGIPQGRGQFVFNDSLGNSDRPIIVYTYRPAAWDMSGPVLIVMPGAGREGQSPRETWIPYAEQYSSLLVVPEFSLGYYPTDSWYNLGNTYDSSNWRPKANWTYMAVEHLFDDIRKKSGAKQDTYLLFGHSAGAQFVHRMVNLLPEARYSRAVAANSGVYLLPVYTLGYPFGLKDSPLSESNLPKIFARKLIIMSGGSDTDPKDPSLANFPVAEAQGSTRFERARYYFNLSQAEAQRLHVPFNWEYHVVPGVGHSESGMAGPSAALLFIRP